VDRDHQAARASKTWTTDESTVHGPLAVRPPRRARLEDIERVVILMHDNRSFD
jgi:phospholipase C